MSPPRLAATVLLVRDTPAGLEVFMERRHIQSDFVGGAYVFPGGAVDPEDRIDPALCTGQGDAAASLRLGVLHGGLAFYVAAIRECFEEAGILLAYDQHGALLDFRDPGTDERFRQARAQLNAGDLSLVELAARERLRLATDRIEYWAHWITPAGQPRRYDTRFFIAQAPANQTAGHDQHELTSSAWVRPEEALVRGARREWTIIFPTVKNLLLLRAHPTCAQALAAARARTEFPVNQPRVLTRDGQARVVLPGDDGYDQAPEDASASDPRAWLSWTEEVLGPLGER